MELNTLKTPIFDSMPDQSPKKRQVSHLSIYNRKNPLVSKSGINFKSFDDYINESIVQSYFPKKNQEDLDLVFIRPDDIEKDILEEKANYEEEQTEQSNKNCFTRYFGPLNPGSLRASIFALMACALGAGSLALPKALFMKCGFINGLLLLILTAIITLICLNFLTKSSMKANIMNYSMLVSHCFSKKVARLAEIIFVIYSFGTITSYQIIITQFFMVTLKSFGLDPSTADSIWTKTIQVLLLTLLITPIALQTSFYSLRHVNILGVLALIYAGLVIICEAPSYISAYWDENNFEWFVWDWNLFTGFSTAVFSYTCTTVVLPIRNELVNPAEYRIMKLFRRSVFMEMIIYLSIGVMGYLSLLNKTTDIILDRPSLNGSKDIFITIARIALILNLSISIPINVNPGRSHFYMLINSDKNREISRFLHYIITLGFLFGSAGLSIVFPDILAAFSFLGGACSVVIGITFPSLMWLKLNDKKLLSVENVIILVFCLILTITGLIAACLSFLQAIQVVHI